MGAASAQALDRRLAAHVRLRSDAVHHDGERERRLQLGGKRDIGRVVQFVKPCDGLHVVLPEMLEGSEHRARPPPLHVRPVLVGLQSEVGVRAPAAAEVLVTTDRPGLLLPVVERERLDGLLFVDLPCVDEDVVLLGARFCDVPLLLYPTAASGWPSLP